MCGGKGTRMNLSQEKLLLQYKKPIIEHVINALQQSNCFSKIFGATSKNSPKTQDFLTNLGISIIETKGSGYVNDLNQALHNFKEPVFVISGDMPLLDSKIIKKIIKLVDAKKKWITIILSIKFLESLGIKPEYLLTYNKKEYAYSGISVVDPVNLPKTDPVKETYVILDDKRIAINLNTKQDVDLLSAA